MTKILTDAQYNGQFEEDKAKGIAKQVSNYRDREEIRYIDNAYTRNECNHLIHLKHGLQLRIWSFENGFG